MHLPVSRKIYRFVSFNQWTLDSIVQGHVYYSDPTHFNDPFDCRIDIEDDALPIEKLRELWRVLLPDRDSDPDAELYQDDYTFWRLRIDGKEKQASERICLLKPIQELLKSNLRNHGVLCLSARFNASLMWAHYADRHKGICLEYDLKDIEATVGSRFQIRRVDYWRGNTVPVSVVHSAFADGEEKAMDKILNAYFFTKSAAWQYEEEWRVIKTGTGAITQPGLLSGIFFGLRCPDSVKTAIIKLLGGGPYAPKFYCMEGFGSQEAAEPSTLKAVPLPSTTIQRRLQSDIPGEMRSWVLEEARQTLLAYDREKDFTD